MYYYFQLQARLLWRRLADLGLPPLLIVFVYTVGFGGFSWYAFQRTPYAAWAYPFLAITYLVRLGTPARNDFLRTCFPMATYRKVRLLENLLVALPFLLVLLFFRAWLITGVLLLITTLMSWAGTRAPLSFPIPTPFGLRPFEFAVGFRRTFLFLGLILFVAIMAVSVGNFNLGVFALLLLYFTAMAYYYPVEPLFYVWIFADSPRSFLWKKVQTALLYSTLLCLPLLLLLGFVFPDNWKVLLIALTAGQAYVLMMLFAKYADYPANIHVGQEFLLALGILFPPLILGLLPFFYFRSLRQLKPYLS
jgi:hypothetical protein